MNELNNQIHFSKIDDDFYSYNIFISGAYPFYLNNPKIVMRELAKIFTEFPDKKICISYINEPYIFTTIDHLDVNTIKNSYTMFDFIHDFCKKYKIHESKIVFISGNKYCKTIYDNWCKIKTIKNKFSINEYNDTYWPKRILNQGFQYLENIEKKKKICMIIGKPNLQKNYVVKWYIDNILNTAFEEDCNASFLYGGANLDYYNLDNNYRKKIDLLPGMIENKKFNFFTQDSKSYLPENFNTNKMSKFIGESLISFVVDYHELENFSNYEDYMFFKKQNTWWSENYLSEKIYKPIFCKNPFIILGMPGKYKLLKNLGYKTFNGVLFDETFDSESDFHKSFNSVIGQIEQILKTPFNDLKEKVLSNEVQDIVNYNYDLVMKNIKERENYFEHTA